MAYYAALTSLLQTLEQIRGPCVHEQITSLRDKVSRSLVILDGFSPKSSLAIQDLEGRIRDASYQAEDIIQSQIPRQVLSKCILSCGVSTCFWELIPALQNMIPAIHLPRQRLMDAEVHGLEQIIHEFGSILDDLSNKINDGEVDLQPEGGQDPQPRIVEDPQPRNSTGADSSRFPASNESPLVGLDADLEQLMDRLTGSTSKLDIISIVGMGGIGKTTLARNLYDDSFVKTHFDTRAWIVVSQEYHVREMFTGLLNSTRHDGGELHQKSIQQLSLVLYKSLKERRYLIVMDDVWDTGAWDEVRRYFPDDNNGSRVILTTRLSEVANYARAGSPIHQMSLLSSEASWNLLREKVFGKESCPFELQEIGKKIAEDCKGLPLAITVIGGLLSKGSRTRDYWEYTAENVKSAVTGNDDQFMQILFTSYNSLPHCLKPCFLYIGVFPEDHEILASKLIKLWIAEGFVKPPTPKCLEDVAENYLNDLLERSLIMVQTRNHNGGIKTCTVHDLLRDLCVKKARDDRFLQIMNRSDFTSQGRSIERRVSIQSDILYHFMNDHDSSVRSLIYFCKRYSNYKLLSFTMSCRLLRVFDALTIRFYEFPIEIVELVHLRYLAFLYRGNSFPASISKLQNLQTIIALSVQPIYLPPTIWEMPQLRHLFFEESFLPAQILWKNCVVLENLQTLSGVTNFRFTKKVFELMRNLKKLGISYIHDTDTKWSSYEFNNFVYLSKLEKLKCLFIAKRLQAERRLPINLAFPPNLKRLTLSGCRISWENMRVISSLPNLEVLKLKDHAFEGSEWKLNDEEEYRELKFLLIHTSFLENWIADNSHFPKLRHLSLSCCPKLVELPTDIEALEMLELHECNPSAEESAMQIQKEQEDLDNPFRIRISSYKRVYDSQQQNTSLQRATESLSESSIDIEN